MCRTICQISNFLSYSFVLFLGSILIIVCTAFSDAFSSRQEQLERITKYETVIPRRLEDGRYRRDVNTLQENGHIEEPSFILPIDGEEYILDLYLNDILFADGYIERAYDHIPTDTLPHRTHHCYYQGVVRGANTSQVALSTCNGLSGYILLEGSIFYIQPLQDAPTEHLLFRPEDVIRDEPFYTFGDYPPDFEELGELRLQEIEKRSHERVRRNVHDEIKYVEIVLVGDSKLLERHGSMQDVQEKFKSVVNIMDSIYKPLNTRVVLASVVVWKTDPYVVSTDASRALNQFETWRENELVPTISHDNAQFVTGLNFDGSTVGMAAVSTMCSRDRSCGVSEDHGNMDNDLASTIAHEMGHNLGLNHDTKDCFCADSSTVGCVMAASSGGNPPLMWSSCSEDMFRENLERGLGACMFNYPKVIFDGPICQNGFVEEGEECDCGPVAECDNPCCIAETCRLEVNATCAFGECCENCQLKEAGHLCRVEMNDCDLPEYCNGYQEECPGNVYRQNGVECPHSVSDLASCFNGMCMSYDDQCVAIWGEGASVAHPKCWRYNTQRPSAFGNCGVDDSGNYIRCSSQNKKCGKLLCEGGATFPLLGSLAMASQGYIFDEDGVKRLCKSASLDQGEDIPDPGYVADGSPCDKNKFCYEYKCVNHSAAGVVACPQNCNGNGICNSENHCHCDDGYAWPTCSSRGHGGSQDSGPTVPIVPDILTTVEVVTPPRTTTASSQPRGTGSPDTTPTDTFSDPLGTAPTPGGLVMMIVLAVGLAAIIVLFILFGFWKREMIKRKLNCKRLKLASAPPMANCKYTPVQQKPSPVKISRPKHAPPPQPTAPPISVVIEHPAHISGQDVGEDPPPPYSSPVYANFQDSGMRPARVAPTAPPVKAAKDRRWSNSGVHLVPTTPQVKYQKMDDPVMYDEPPKVDFVDDSIPRPSASPAEDNDNRFAHLEHPSTSPSTSNRYEQSLQPNVQFRLPSAAAVTKPTHPAPTPPTQPAPTPPLKPAPTPPLKPAPTAPTYPAPTSPTYPAPTPPSKPVNNSRPAVSEMGNQEPQMLFGQVALKPTGLRRPSETNESDQQLPSPAGFKLPGQAALKPTGLARLRQPSDTDERDQAAFKPPGQAALKPPDPGALKPPGPAALKPSGQAALKPAPVPPKPQAPPSQAALKPAPPVKPSDQEATVLPAAKPVPVTHKPVLANKPTLPSKPTATVTPSPRTALRPVGLQRQENWNNSASSGEGAEDREDLRVKVGPRNSFRGGSKPQVAPPPPPGKGKPPLPQKPVKV